MSSPLSGPLARAIHRAMKPIFLDATLTRDAAVTGSPDINSFDPREPTQVEYPCKAIVEEYSEKFRLDGLVQSNERKVIVLAQSLDVTPKAGDRIEIRSQTFSVIDVMVDPALAAWTCKARWA